MALTTFLRLLLLGYIASTAVRIMVWSRRRQPK